VDTVQVYILQIAFWLSGIPFCISANRKEKFLIKTVMMASIIVALTIGFQQLDTGSEAVQMLSRALAGAIMILYLFQGWEISLSVAVYDTIWGFSVWNLLVGTWKLIYIFGKEMLDRNVLGGGILCALLFMAGYRICANTIAAWMPKDRKKRIGPRQTISAVLIICVIELLANAPALRSIDSYNEDWKFLFVSQVMCIIILYMQNELFKKSVIKHELEVMNLLWEKEQERYHLSKENIALMNQKSHDLKHQIRALRHMGKEEFDECLNEIEDNVNIYEAIVKTGNNVFDTILTEKSLYCKERDIHVSCVADGSQMNFIATVDLYVILGNAMDNAIEAVEKFKEIEKRQIDVIIYRKQQFLIMNFINPIPETLVYEGKFPVTTKGDQRSHGFGLRSIWHLAKKYDGHIIVSEEDDCFSLKILIPIQKMEENDE
jgi:hypothetical protein